MANSKLEAWKKKYGEKAKTPITTNNNKGEQNSRSASPTKSSSTSTNANLEAWKKKYSSAKTVTTNADKRNTTTSTQRPTMSLPELTNEARAKNIGFDTFTTDLQNTNKMLVDAMGGWQSPETMSQTKAAAEDMYKRLGNYITYDYSVNNPSKGLTMPTLGQANYDAIKLRGEYKKAIDGWDDRTNYYGLYADADSYNKEQEALNQLYSMTAAEIEKVPGYKTNSTAYITATGEKIKWQDLYAETALKEYEQNIDNTIDVEKNGAFVRKDAGYKEPSGLALVNTVPQYQISDKNAHIYNLINGDDEAWTAEDRQSIALYGYNDDAKNRYFTEEERKRFNAIWEIQGEEAAIEYYHMLADKTRARRKVADDKFWAEQAAKDPVGSSIFSVLVKPASDLIELPLLAFDYASDREIDPNSIYYKGSGSVSSIRSTVDDMIDNDFGKFFYGAGMSLADNVTAMAAGGFGKLGVVSKVAQTAIMSSGSFTQTTLNAKTRGLSDEQALSLGAIAGAAEMVFESKSFDKLFGGENLSKGAMNFFIDNMKTELIGELGTELTNDVADFLIAQDMSQWSESIAAYQRQGMSQKEALQHTIGDNLLKYAEVAGTTFLTAGVISGTSSISMQMDNTSIGKTLRGSDQVSNMFDLAASAPESSQLHEAYANLVEKGITAENINDSQLGNLYRIASTEAYSGMDEANKEKAKVERVVGKQVDIVASDKSDAKKDKAQKKVDKVADSYANANTRIGQYGEMQTKLAKIDYAVNQKRSNSSQDSAGASESDSAPLSPTTTTPNPNAPKTELEAKEEAVTDAVYKAGRANVALEQVAEILDTPEKVEAYERGRVDYIEQDLPKQVKKSAGTPIVERLDALTSDNETIYADEVKQATSFGDKGSQVIADIANTDGVTFSQAKKQTAAAYLAGFTDSDSSQFTTEAQKKAYAAGVEDRATQTSERVKSADDFTAYEGEVEKSEYYKRLPRQAKKMAKTLAKDFGLSERFVEKLVAAVVDGETYYANAQHEDGVLSRSSNSDYAVHEDLVHEALHRMMQVSPQETGLLLDALYEQATQSGRAASLGVNSSVFDSIKDEYGAIDESMKTLDILEEIGAQTMQTIFDNAKEFNKWRAKLESDANLNKGWKKIVEFISELIEKIKTFISQMAGTSKEKAKAKEVIKVLERYADAYKATMNAVERKLNRDWDELWEEEQAQKNTDTESGVNRQNVKNSFHKSKNGTANDLLTPYSEELRKVITQNGDYILDNFDDLKNAVNMAFDNPQKKATAYFGIVPTDILTKIEKNIPNLPKDLESKLFKLGKDYSVATTLDSIRHLADEKSLSREDIVDYLDRVADTIVEFDTVSFNFYIQGNAKLNGILFKKSFEDGTMQSFEIVSHKKRALNLQTMYMEHGDYKKKKSAETMLMDNPSADVQDAGRSNFNGSVSHNPKNVNSKFSLKDIRFSLKTKDIEGKPIDPERISSNDLDVRYSLKHNKDIAKGQLEYLEKNKAYISEEELKEAQKVTSAMVDVMMKYSTILPEDKIGKVLTKNGSYDRSVENTTICVRTLAYNEFIDKVQEEIGRPLTQMESFLVSQKLYDIATEPQCLYCYVSLDRKAFNEMLLRYMHDRDTVIAKYNESDKSDEAVSKLYEEFLNGRKDTKEMKSRFDKWIGYVDNGTQLLSLADIATEDRQSVIKAEGGILAEQLADARKYAQSASWSKIQKNYVAYRDEILKLGGQVVKNLNEHYGLRWYSFSDYSAAFIVENMQQITDASIRGLKGLAYTKDTDFVEIFAPSGMNINVSVFVNQDANGNFYIDEKQSADFEKAQELRAKYPNVGIVATVTNDEALKWAGEQEWSDVIIPFHIVRTGTDVAEYYKWLNYTSESGDTIKDNDLWNAYVDSLNPKSENARKKVSKNIYPSEHKNNKETYLSLCESRGLNPRFVRFAGESWYMKLVNETRLSADDSSVLKPNFNQQAAQSSFQKFVDKGGYEGGWYKEGVEVDEEAKVVASDVLAGKKANEVDYGRQDNFNPEELVANRKGNRTHGASNSLKGSKNIAREVSALLDAVEDLQTGKSEAAERLSKYVDSHLISTETYQEMIEKYGAIKKGEKPYRDVSVPAKTDDDKKVSQTVRTILEAKATPDEMLPTIEKMVEDGVFSYDVYTDKQAISDTENYLKEYGWVESLNDWLNDVKKGVVSKQHTAMGWALYNNAANTAATATSKSEKDTAIQTTLTILNAMVEHQRNAAQALQATRILKKLSPETQLYGVQKSVNALQKELTDKYGKKAPNLKIDEKLAEDFLKAKTEEDRKEAIEKIYKDIGKQMPSRFADKWNAWRYLAMLGNVRTHVRNVVGNAAFAPIVAIKNLTATGIEAAVWRVSGKKMMRGKALVTGSKQDRALLEAAWEDYANVADLVSNGGKYNDFAMANQSIQDGRQIFKFKPLEAARKGNSALLEKEDVMFAKPHYAFALAMYCKANNITAEQIKRGRAIEPAREYAIKEAQKATYKDTNEFSQLVSSLGKYQGDNKLMKAGSMVIDGILPFRKTPANILARGVEYSPIGLLKSLSYDLAQVAKGEKTATEAIDGISAGLTGTGLCALGVLLSALGLIRGHGEDEEKEKGFKELMGHQAYSLELPNGQSITLDWLAPEALPFFVGVNIWEATKGSGEKVNLSSILKRVSGITEPMLEMSCLQSLNDVFESVGYASSNDMSSLTAVLTSAATSYLSQAIPTLLGQAERTGEAYRMTTYTEKDDFLTSDMQYTWGKWLSKIPFVDYNQIPYIDAWGRKEASGTALKRGFNNFLNPAYTSTIEESKMEKELLRLYEQTGEDSVFPQRAKKYFTVDGKRKDLTADEYVRYATLKGEKSYKLITDLVNSAAYKKLDDDEKVKAIEEAYTYADQKAKQAISNYAPDKWVTTMDEAGAGASDYLAFRADVSDTRTDNGGKISKEEVTNIVTGMAQNDSEAWLMYLSMYDNKSAIEAEELGIDAKLYMTAVVELDNIYSDYRVNGKIVDGKNLTKEERAQAKSITDSRRKKVEKYLKSICETDMEYWFLLGTEFESVKDDQIYLKHVGK